MNAKPQRSVLFVCLGNICRSPLAEGVFRQVATEAGRGDRFFIDSAGTGAWHEGDMPDRRSVEVAARHGIDISQQRARKIRQDDFPRFDLIFGMDRSNIANLARMTPSDRTGAVHLFMHYAVGRDEEIPDPYYGGLDGFESVYRTIREASELLVAKLG